MFCEVVNVFSTNSLIFIKTVTFVANSKKNRPMKTPKILFLILAISAIVSCSKTEENISLDPPTGEIVVDELVREASLRNQIIPFKVINEVGEDVSDITTFYVDDIEIEGNTFYSETIGEFEVYGVYNEEGVEITTNTEDFRVIIPKRKVVIEDYTGTWCGYCPRVTAAIEVVHEETEDVAIVAIHETANSNPDPMHFPQVQDLKDTFGVVGFPAARINRTTTWDQPHNVDDVTSMAGTETNIAIAINSELTDNNLIVEVELVYEEGSETGDRLVVYLVESGVIHPQTNYFNSDPTSPYFEMGNPIPEFVHNDALRNSLTQILGDDVSGTAALISYTRTFSLEIPSNYNSNNLRVVAMLVSSDNTTRNAQFAEVNENKSYE